jgi:hypothetical protein
MFWCRRSGIWWPPAGSSTVHSGTGRCPSGGDRADDRNEGGKSHRHRSGSGRGQGQGGGPGVRPPTFRFSGLRMRVRQAPHASVACIAALIRTPLNADECMRMRPKMSPPGLPLPSPRPSPVVAWEMRRARISLHRYVYLITLDRVGSAWTMAAQGTADLQTSDYQKPLLDGAGHDGTLLVTNSGTSRHYVLMPDVGGCFGWVKGRDDHGGCLGYGERRSGDRSRRRVCLGRLGWDAR